MVVWSPMIKDEIMVKKETGILEKFLNYLKR